MQRQLARELLPEMAWRGHSSRIKVYGKQKYLESFRSKVILAINTEQKRNSADSNKSDAELKIKLTTEIYG